MLEVNIHYNNYVCDGCGLVWSMKIFEAREGNDICHNCGSKLKLEKDAEKYPRLKRTAG